MYDYVVIYVDNLFASMHDPGQFFTDLQSSPWKYKLKGVGEPSYHLGTVFFYDTDGTPCMGTQTYVKQLLVNDEKLFDVLPWLVFSAMADNDHPELDASPLCSLNDVAKYQLLISIC